MPGDSTLSDFAQALATQVDRTRPHALVGMSMGGMVAQELAAVTSPTRVVIISSWKGPSEMPGGIRSLRGKRPERLLTKSVLERALPFVRWQMGVEDPASEALFNALVNAHTLAQLRVQLAACLAWDGPAMPVSDLVHIHGDKDRLMPIHLIERPVRIPGGGHFMVFDRAEEVSAALMQALAPQD